MLYLTDPAVLLAYSIVVGLLAFAFGLALSIPRADRRAGRGNLHRAPGLPRVRPSRSRPRRRAPRGAPMVVVPVNDEDYELDRAA